MLNKYQWENYLLSGGNKIVTIFQDFLNCENLDKFTSTIKTLVNDFCPDKNRGVELEKRLNKKLINEPFNNQTLNGNDKSCTTTSELNKLYKKVADSIRHNNSRVSSKDVLIRFLNEIDLYTTDLSFKFPDLFVPYYFKLNFNVFSYIVDMFRIDLELNKIPIKSDFRGRFYYYRKICNALKKFRLENNLSIAELWAFLYDYAPKCVGGSDYIQTSLPKPRSAFFIGGTSEDLFSNSSKSNEYPKITRWQCNSNTRAGDMIIFYMTSPDSRIDSIWRSVSEGFNDPFFWYYRCAYMSYVEKVPDNLFTIKNMKSDDVLSKLPIVRKNMQGVNGTEIPPETYNYIIEKANIKNAPKIKYIKFKTNFKTGASNLKIENEHDVEIKLLEPLLSELGWNNGDYITQMILKIGRNEKIIADYVISPIFTPGHEKGEFIWEAKKNISNENQLDSAKNQVRSYARQLNAKKCAVISKEGIWIMDKKDDYTKDIFHSSFKDLKNPNVFKKLINIAGKKKHK